MQKKLKTDLFRFVTLRSPQLISKDRRALGFVENPDPTASRFLKTIIEVTDLASARANLNEAAAGFKPYTSVEQVKSEAKQFWEFSLWLSKNKNSLTLEKVGSKPKITALSKTATQRIWDNLFYDILTNKNSNIRQACLQVLVGISFSQKFFNQLPLLLKNAKPNSDLGENEQEILGRLANGKVVVPSAFTGQKKSIKSPAKPITKPSYRRQRARHSALMAREDVKALELVRDEISNFESVYNNEYEEKYTASYSSYAANSESVIANYVKNNPVATQHRAVADADSGAVVQEEISIEYLIPDDLVPEFEFEFLQPFSDGYAKEHLTNASLDFVAKNKLKTASIPAALKNIDNQIRKAKKEAARVIRKRKKNVLLNGVLIKPNKKADYDYSISFREESITTRQGTTKMVALYLAIHTGYIGSFPNNGSYSMLIEDIKFADRRPAIISNDSDVLLLKLFTGQNLNVGKSQFSFGATIELDNGKTIQINKKGIGTTAVTSGTAVELTPVPSTDGLGPVINGINKIGVADYRKVEQELCCYVAGEVSHIENILAKEYKEKSTRNLVSSEVSTESTNEYEIEELTDTTTTTRHEMSTEVAEVINKDRSANLGFNAGVSGKYLGQEYTAGIYGDFAFGQSTSDSNTTARNYAEDVTRRALERIVQKVTVKRSSRILREFEENNKHGFDNREGENHVTGVYRWIDKIYKNRLVNYGKKLLYEFMIPEPARFYNEAIIIKSEDEEDTGNTGNGSTGDTGVAIKPSHPSEHGINDASNLTREEYNSITSIYGISVDPPKEAEVTVATSFTHSIGNKDKPQSFTNSDLFVPPDYQCTEFKGSASYSWKARWNPRAYIKVSAGGQTWKHEDRRGTGNGTLPLNRTNVNGVENQIPVAVNTRKITSFTVSLEAVCTLKENIFSLWQQDTYDAIMRAYNQQLQAFNDAQAANEAEDAVVAAENGVGESISRNPKFNKQIVMTELRRLCIEMLMKPFGLQQGRDLYNDGDCNIPEINQGAILDTYAAQVKFFEQAFDWNIISYLFYPYYWADRCDWEDLYQLQDSVDYSFQAFIQSGMGRVMVPVREGFEDAVVYFMETGEVWNGTGIVFDTDDDLYLSIVDEMNHTEGIVEGEEWETIVPSSLTVVQARSVLLDDEGLPCCETDEAVLAELNLKSDENTLQRLDELTA